MRFQRLILVTASLFTFMAVHTSWGKGFGEGQYAEKVETKLTECLDAAKDDANERAKCNSDAVKKLLKWHQGAFKVVPWRRNVPDCINCTD